MYKVQFYSFAWGYPVFSPLFIEEGILACRRLPKLVFLCGHEGWNLLFHHVVDIIPQIVDKSLLSVELLISVMRGEIVTFKEEAVT